VDNNDIIGRHLNIEMNATQIKTESDAGEKAGWLEIVRRQVGSLRFGVVQIVDVALLENRRGGSGLHSVRCCVEAARKRPAGKERLKRPSSRRENAAGFSKG